MKNCPVCGSDNPAVRDRGFRCCMDPFHDSAYPPPRFGKGKPVKIVEIKAVQLPEGWVWAKDHEIKLESKGSGLIEVWVDGVHRLNATGYAVKAES